MKTISEKNTKMSGANFRNYFAKIFLMLSIFLVIIFVKKSPMNISPTTETLVFTQYQVSY